VIRRTGSSPRAAGAARRRPPQRPGDDTREAVAAAGSGCASPGASGTARPPGQRQLTEVGPARCIVVDQPDRIDLSKFLIGPWAPQIWGIRVMQPIGGTMVAVAWNHHRKGDDFSEAALEDIYTRTGDLLFYKRIEEDDGKW
jgi:hypothetical protein